jgi:hypothetical protein
MKSFNSISFSIGVFIGGIIGMCVTVWVFKIGEVCFR